MVLFYCKHIYIIISREILIQVEDSYDRNTPKIALQTHTSYKLLNMLAESHYSYFIYVCVHIVYLNLLYLF